MCQSVSISALQIQFRTPRELWCEMLWNKAVMVFISRNYWSTFCWILWVSWSTVHYKHYRTLMLQIVIIIYYYLSLSAKLLISLHLIVSKFALKFQRKFINVWAGTMGPAALWTSLSLLERTFQSLFWWTDYKDARPIGLTSRLRLDNAQTQAHTLIFERFRTKANLNELTIVTLCTRKV